MVDPDARATALLWKGDTLIAVGTDAEILTQAANWGIETEDLDGRAIIPGFVDAHTHFLHVGVKHTRPDLRHATTLQEALETVLAWMEANYHVEGPIIAEGWDEGDWSGDPAPTRHDLDRIAPDRPLVLRRICGHKAVANSAALPAILARWDDPALVDVETGILLEQPSLYLNEVMPVPDAGLDAALQAACEIALRLGVTTVGDYSQMPYRQAMLRAAASGTLRVRVCNSIYTQDLQASLAQGFRTGRRAPGPDGASEWLQDAGLKVFLDGSLGGHTAYLREPYLDKETRGMPNWTDEEVLSWFKTAHEAGIQIHAHAIGDGAIDQGLAAFEALEGEHDLRHRFEHFEIVHDEQLERSAKLDIVASCQPNFVGAWSAKGGMYEERLGPRFWLNNRFQAFRNKVRLAFGSDGMPFGPLFGLQSAIEHPLEGERLSMAQAVWHYTAEAAWSLHRPDVGTLVPGNKADLLILDQQDWLDGPTCARPGDWIFMETIVAGQTEARGTRPILHEDAMAP